MTNLEELRKELPEVLEYIDNLKRRNEELEAALRHSNIERGIVVGTLSYAEYELQQIIKEM